MCNAVRACASAPQMQLDWGEPHLLQNVDNTSSLFRGVPETGVVLHVLTKQLVFLVRLQIQCHLHNHKPQQEYSCQP